MNIFFNLIYGGAFVGSLTLALILVPIVKKLAWQLGIIDRAGTKERKIHSTDKPLLGGLAVFISFFVIIGFIYWNSWGNFSRISGGYLLAIFGGSILIMIGGILDDKFNLKPWQQIIWPLLATLVVLSAGIKIGYVTNPLGGPSNSIIYLIPTVGWLISFAWLMGMMYTTKFLDGLDGLAAGIGIIAALIIFILSLNWDVPLSGTGIMALALAGALAGFLFFNWQPAKIFLGEGGSIYIGFMLGVLSIISGSKIATTLLVVGLPALDVGWVFIQRLVRGESPFSHADRKHLHYRLVDLGFSSQGAVLFLYLLSLTFGATAILAESFGKLIALAVLSGLMAVLALLIYLKSKQKA
ncbi:MAG TPA: MraY family glycosyltransferase [bacterium]|nr:MraY family glycosyltransferase [bacterium]HNZ73398.1 MraY family glycosyltransferase [bacterium]HOH67268.1 MraY family glycosyltransferase [bacterium]HPN81705.1 MraY family glycosyltransferase [bacterium]HPW39243.1 MraY family glycosyltransferase [bacterium]